VKNLIALAALASLVACGSDPAQPEDIVVAVQVCQPFDGLKKFFVEHRYYEYDEVTVTCNSPRQVTIHLNVDTTKPKKDTK
jgi:hypothetical protein